MQLSVFIDKNTVEYLYIPMDSYDYSIDIKLKDGQKYYTMGGQIVTIHKRLDPLNQLYYNFYVNRYEFTGNKKNIDIETYLENGIAYSNNSNNNILKKVI